jgi:hypothetical protein
MIVIWRGHGWLVLAIPFVVFFMLGAGPWVPGFDAWWKPMRGTTALEALVLGVSGLLVLAFGLLADRGAAQWVIDPITGHECRRRTRHSLYGVPMQLWGLAGIAAGWWLAPVGLLPFAR